jgi:Cys-rich repeat protein
MSGCVDSRCARNSECPAGEVCIVATGRCAAPECTSDSQCGAGRICDAFACVPGCRADAECAKGETCFSNRCVPIRSGCDCPASPEFCGIDQNGKSPLTGLNACVPDSFPDGVALVFGSVLCGHCRALLDSLLVVRNAIRKEGGKPVLALVQVPDLVVDAKQVTQAMEDRDVPVFQDTVDKGIWQAFHADWYHLVILDRNGCLASHLGPLTPEDVSGSQKVHDAWAASLQAVCKPLVADPVDAAILDVPDVPLKPDAAEGVADPGADTADLFLADLAELVADVVVDLVPEGPDSIDVPDAPDVPPGEVFDAPAEAWVEPFTLTDVCQVAEGPPIATGELVRHFLCKDVNPSSATNGAGVSDIVLREQVWIAYFGSCT